MMNLDLISVTTDAPNVIFTAFRTCYSKQKPCEIWNDIQNNKITQEEVEEFIHKMLTTTNHVSPLRHVNFTFALAGVSRTLTAQLNRHSIGVAISESSQRYINFDSMQFVIPPSIKNNPEMQIEYNDLCNRSLSFYNYALKHNIPKEDARFGLLMASQSREVVTFSFEALQHFIDLRLCTQSQWEIRNLAKLMVKEINTHFPVLKKYFGIKCMDNRSGMCDEMYNKYKQCPMSKTRPHRDDLFKLWNNKNNNKD